MLCREWKNRVKGRDWYDLVWYVGRQTKLNLLHLEQRMIQSGHWERSRKMTPAGLQVLLEKRINEVDFNQARREVFPFLRDPDSAALWSKEFFKDVIEQLRTVQ
jgi:hypothetical protein